MITLNREKELNRATEEVLLTINESEVFKERLKSLITNAMEDSYLDDDILAIINLMGREE